MSAIFDRVYIYNVTAVCKTPFRTADTDGNPDEILQDSQGIPLIQGSSIAGALKEWLELRNRQMASTLFGSQKNAGHLVVSDGTFKETETSDGKLFNIATRPRLRIHGPSGTAMDGHKYELSFLSTNSSFVFSLTLMGDSNSIEQEADAVNSMLQAVNQNEIRFGAQKTNGFGKVRISVERWAYDLRKADERSAWLNNQPCHSINPLPLNEGLSSSLIHMSVFCSGYSSILVKADAADIREEDRRYTVNITENGTPIIPGSSVKGGLRQRVQMIADLLSLRKERVNAIFGSSGKEDGEASAAGTVYVSDIRLDRGKAVSRSRIRIDRFTGGVMNGAMINEDPILGGDLLINLSILPKEKTACGLLLYAIRDLHLGLWSLGSGSSVGRGRITVDHIEITDTLGKKVTVRFSADGKTSMEGETALVDEWLNQVKEAAEDDNSDN